MKNIKEVEIKVKLENGAVLPKYAKEGDAGADLVATEDVLIPPRGKAIVKTGLFFDIPELDQEIQVRPRSGLSLNTRINIPNSPGTIDWGYVYELGVIVENTSLPYKHELVDGEVKLVLVKPEDAVSIDDKTLDEAYIQIRKGDRIAQMVGNEVIRWNFVEVEKLRDKNDRGGGFGSTGTRKEDK